MTHRSAALAAGLVLLVVLVAAVAVTTPWHPLPGTGRGDWRLDFTAAERAREVAFHRAVRPSAYASLAVGLAAAAVLGLGPGRRLAEAMAAPLGGGWVWRATAGVVVVVVGRQLATLALDARTESVLRRSGLSTRSWAGWAADTGKATALSVGVTLLLLLPLLLLARRLPRWWWAPGAAGVAAVVVVLSAAYPLVVEPVFNRFHALPAGPQRDELLGLAARDHLRVRDVLVADASRRTTAENAYVSGVGATRRVVVYDTLLQRASPAELRLVVAHELGHAKAGDVTRGTLLGALGAAGLLCLAGAALGRGAGDPRHVPAVLAVLALGGALVMPAANLVSRRVESRADAHALELTHDPATAVAAERRLALANLGDLDPSPLLYGLFATHPSATQRIAAARAWARDHGLPVPPPLVGAAAGR